MTPRKESYSDLGGGLNEGAPAGALSDNEFTNLVNFYPFGRKLVRRGGTTTLTTVPHGRRLTSVFDFRPEIAVDPRAVSPLNQTAWTIFGTTVGFARLLASKAIEPLAGTLLAENVLPWVMLQYKSVGYAMRKGTDGLQRFTAALFDPAGIAQPSTAPTVASGGAGALTAADYDCIVTFGNRESGAESDWSPVGTVTIAANERIAWSAIPVSTDSQVNMRRLYRTLPDAQGVYLFVGQIDDNSTTTFDDNVTIDDMGDFASPDNGLPPSGLQFGDFWQERLFASDGVDLWYSEPFLPESWSGDFIRVSPDDGFAMTAIHAFDKNRLIVAKQNRIEYLTPAGSSFAKDTLTDEVGCASHHSMKSAEGRLIWWSGSSFFMSLGGAAPVDIASVKLRKTLAKIDPTRHAHVTAAIFPKHGWYIASVRVKDGYTPTGLEALLPPPHPTLPNNVILCFNYRSGAWCKFEFPAQAPNFLARSLATDGRDILYALFYDGHLHELDRGYTDLGSSITASFRTKAFRWGMDGFISAIRHFYVLLTNQPIAATFRLYKNQSAVAALEREDVSLFRTEGYGTDTDWKAIKMSTLGQPAGEWQAEMEYTGGQVVEIEAMAFDIVPIGRRVKMR